MTKRTEEMIKKASTEDLSATEWRDLQDEWREEVYYDPSHPWHFED